MKTIVLPAGCEFIHFDGYQGVGWQIAAAEFPDERGEGVLDARMRHDLKIGPSLLDAVRQGRLRVRDCQTRFPLKPDAPSVEVLPSLVSLNDLREFVADLGYDVQVGSEPEGSAFQVASVIQPPETPPTTPAQSPGHPEAAMKKKALVEMFEHEWPSINADLNEMSRNGLRTAAHAGRHGYFYPSKAKVWAVSQGKFRQTPASTWPPTSGAHSIFAKNHIK